MTSTSRPDIALAILKFINTYMVKYNDEWPPCFHSIVTAPGSSSEGQEFETHLEQQTVSVMADTRHSVTADSVVPHSWVIWARKQ